jgi:hypothetical protein
MTASKPRVMSIGAVMSVPLGGLHESLERFLDSREE